MHFTTTYAAIGAMCVNSSRMAATIRSLSTYGRLCSNIVEAEDGRQALEFFMAGQFEIVLTDWNMPNMDGLELLKEIRQRNQDIPVIMITTESERARVVTAIQAGCSDYLVKPFTPDGLKDKLEKWVTVDA